MKNTIKACEGTMATIGTMIHTWLCGECVGADEFGNRYFQARRAPKEGRRRRWVMYKGVDEASKVPPLWHGWLHYTTDEVPPSGAANERYRWQKPHIPNLTGTENAHLPPGHLLRGGKRAGASADYQPWRP